MYRVTPKGDKPINLRLQPNTTSTSPGVLTGPLIAQEVIEVEQGTTEAPIGSYKVGNTIYNSWLRLHLPNEHRYIYVAEQLVDWVEIDDLVIVDIPHHTIIGKREMIERAADEIIAIGLALKEGLEQSIDASGNTSVVEE